MLRHLFAPISCLQVPLLLLGSEGGHHSGVENARPAPRASLPKLGRHGRKPASEIRRPLAFSRGAGSWESKPQPAPQQTGGQQARTQEQQRTRFGRRASRVIR